MNTDIHTDIKTCTHEIIYSSLWSPTMVNGGLKRSISHQPRKSISKTDTIFQQWKCHVNKIIFHQLRLQNTPGAGLSRLYHLESLNLRGDSSLVEKHEQIRESHYTATQQDLNVLLGTRWWQLNTSNCCCHHSTDGSLAFSAVWPLDLWV